jgi:hypothetical protein
MPTEFASLRFLAGFAPALALGTTSVLDGPGDKLGGRFVAQKDGTINRIACYCTAVSSPVSTDARLESIAAGFPSGSLIAANTSGSFTPTAATLHLVTLTASYAVQAGELLATVLNAPTAGASNTQTFNVRQTTTLELGTGGSGYLYPGSCQDLSAGVWSSLSGHPCIVPVYSDGTYMARCVPNSTSNTHDINNGSNPDERGNRWTQPVTADCIGAWFRFRQLTAGANWNIKLYPSSPDNAAPIVNFAITGNTFTDAITNTWDPMVFWDPVELTAGLDYRITFQPSTANNMRINRFSFANANLVAAMSQMIGTSRLRTADGDDGAWTDVATEYHCIVPIFKNLTLPSAGRRPVLRTQGA